MDRCKTLGYHSVAMGTGTIRFQKQCMTTIHCLLEKQWVLFATHTKSCTGVANMPLHTPTGAAADSRLALRPSEIPKFLAELGRRVEKLVAGETHEHGVDEKAFDKISAVNSVMVLEDPMTAIETLAPRSFTNHFCDHRMERDQFGGRFTGVACGDGDIDLQKTLEIFKNKSNMNRINIEVEWDAGDDGPEAARKKEYDAVVKSIKYCRNVLNI